MVFLQPSFRNQRKWFFAASPCGLLKQTLHRPRADFHPAVEFRPPRLTLRELSLVIALGLIFATLQAAHLYTAVSPDTDEGVHAEAGRLMLGGFVPHRDFYLAHMPLSPLLLGGGLWLMGSMYHVRLVSVLINCLTVLPLYVALRRVAPEWQHARPAALAAAAFYLTYHGMVYHDYRANALRPLVNLCVVSYFALGTVRTPRTWISFLQGLLSLTVAMLFLPGVANVALISGALIVMTDQADRGWVARRYVWIGVLTAASVCLYFWVVPGSLHQVVFDQLQRPSVPRLWRLTYVLEQREDRFFYVLGTLSLIVATMSLRGLRTLSIAMLGMITISLLASSNFYLHYPTVAAPAFAFGVFTFAHEVSLSAQLFRRYATVIVYGALVLAVGLQAGIVLPSLLEKWLDSNPDERLMIDQLAAAPEPVLALTPIYAVEAHKRLVRELEGAYLDPPRGKRQFGVEDYLSFGAMACTILLDKVATRAVPQQVRERWRHDSTVFFENPVGTLLLTHQAHCGAASP